MPPPAQSPTHPGSSSFDKKPPNSQTPGNSASDSTPSPENMPQNPSPDPSNSPSPTTSAVAISGNPSATPSFSIATLPPNTPVAIATLPGSLTISAALGASQIVIGSQTISQNSPPVTLADGNVISLVPSGVVVYNLDGSQDITYNIPTAPFTTQVAIIGGQTISAVAGGSVVVNGQTFSVGDAEMTLGSQVMSLSPTGLVVHSADSPAATYTIPLAVPVPTGGQNLGVVDGQTIYGDMTGSVVVVQGHKLSVGGAQATIDGDQVVSLGSGGLVVAAPNGIVSVLDLSSPASNHAKATGVITTQTHMKASGSVGADSPTTSASSSSGPTSTGRGRIILETFESESAKLMGCGILSWISCISFGMLYIW
ncbi:hypothetical protein BJ878DRAFT_491605 [Calycina marina]|uniref:Uncharacterized protein n=1 Tax=Calycina marina TaxID=1763456 RepID=A0A9P7Z8S0_9HELO|nr:hypothetical protein BJ878DRAFT_491605 [Calycina marina]